MLLNCGVGEDSWESLGLQGAPTSPSSRNSVLNIHWKDWCWSWNSNTLATWCEEPTHLKRPWCWERLKAWKERDDRGWDIWMASRTQWAWVSVGSGNWWWTGKPSMRQCMESQRVGHNWAIELNWTELNGPIFKQSHFLKHWELELQSILMGNTSTHNTWENYNNPQISGPIIIKFLVVVHISHLGAVWFQLWGSASAPFQDPDWGSSPSPVYEAKESFQLLNYTMAYTAWNWDTITSNLPFTGRADHMAKFVGIRRTCVEYLPHIWCSINGRDHSNKQTFDKALPYLFILAVLPEHELGLLFLLHYSGWSISISISMPGMC